MAQITAQLVKQLREQTGAGMMDCKKALTETGGDIDKATDWLREKGIASAAKKAGRTATEGMVHAYIHAGGKLGVLVEVNCETDFAARNDKFQELVKDIAMQIAAAAPLAVRREEIDQSVVAKEREIFAAQARESGKPEKIIERIVDGKVTKFFEENALLEQKFVKDTDKTVEDVIKEAISVIGENISIRRFTRYVLGEGLEKKQEDFAAEVAKAAGG